VSVPGRRRQIPSDSLRTLDEKGIRYGVCLPAGAFGTGVSTGRGSVTTPTSEDTAATKPQAPSGDSRKGGFVAATLEELKLVVWPTRQQLFSESVAVILMVSLSAAAIASVSRFFDWSASQVFR